MSAHPSILGLPGTALAMTARTAAIALTEPSHVDRTMRIESLVRGHHAFVCRSVRRLGVREADLDDAVQEVFLAASKHVEAIEPDRERGFLFRTCMYVAAHARRSVKRRREIQDEVRVDQEIDAAPTPEQNAETAQARVKLQAILDAMPEELRVVFVLFELEATTMIVIAEMLALPAGTVASRLRRARELFVQLAREGTP
jgi:RNA polymerase sigma-70 factor (ECF subfamily)